MTVWINEFHYDNAGTDAGEFIELAGTAGTSLSGYSLVLYNGNGGAAYNTLNLSGTLANQQNGFGTLSFSYPSNGIQNGSPDGIALVGPGNTLIQFLSYEGAFTGVGGAANGILSTDIGIAQTGSEAIGSSLALTGTGSSFSDFVWAADTDDTPGAVNNNQTFNGTIVGTTVSIADAAITEGNTGTQVLTFTVTRSNALTSFSIDFATADGTAAAGSDYVATSGTLIFAASGALTATVSVTINGDTAVEGNETLLVNLGNIANVSGTTTIAVGSATGTINNDDLGVVITAINAIQGAGHTSALVGQAVTTTGIVTAVDSNGYYLQTADANVDASIATSEAIFVFTSSAPTVSVGQAINVSGTVSEFIPGGAATGNLSTTQLSSITGTTILSSGNALPTAILLGAGGRQLPTEVIEDDNFASFDPTTDGIDFFESLEAMRVTVPTPLAVSGTNQFGEIYTVANNGANATNLTPRGSIIIEGSVGDGLNVTNTGVGSDFNPERIQIDPDSTVTPGSVPLVDVGAVLNDVTGVIGYNFGNFEVIPTSAVTVATASTLARETTALSSSATTITVASYNVLNLDPVDNDGNPGANVAPDADVANGRFTAIAQQIVNNLGGPDVIALQEVNDNSGTLPDGTTAANVTLQMLVDAIVAAGGPTYSFIDNPFVVDGQVGGVPGGNIRNAFLYNDARVDLKPGSVITTPDAIAEFVASRVPLVATFVLGGEELTVVNNHFSSKGGSTPLFGATQPSVNGSAADRLVQAQNVADFVSSLPSGTNVVVVGDLNEFHNEESLAPLFAAGLTDLGTLLADDERYSFIFDGNAQALDQSFASASLAGKVAIDIVHVNTEFGFTNATASDHDPSVLAIDLTPANVIGGVRILDAAESLQGDTTPPAASTDFSLLRLGNIAGTTAGSEVVAFEAGIAYSMNNNARTIDRFIVNADGTLTRGTPISTAGLADFGGSNSVAVKNGVVAFAYNGATDGSAGHVALFNAATGALIKTLDVGVGPDQIVFNAAGTLLLTADEAERTSTTSVANGTVTIIDLSSGAANATVRNTIGFTSLDGAQVQLKQLGLALSGNQSVANDIEPEYVAISADGTRAYVTLQEVNGVAVIDLTNPSATAPLSILPLGSIDRNLLGNAFDPSDRNGISIANFDVDSLPQPDAIASFDVGGVTYFVTANEGDARIDDETTVGSSTYVLDPVAYPNAAALKDANALGRLNVLTTVGDTDGDGDFDQITTYGGRGISIFRQNADGTIVKVRETGSEFESVIARDFPALHNSQNLGTADNRSDNKGPEPEGVAVGQVGDRLYAFVNLERVGGVIVYDVTDPENANFVTYRPPVSGDFAPEVTTFVAAADSPTGAALVLTANEVSNTVTAYSVIAQTEGNDTLAGGSAADSFNGRGGNDRLRGNGGNDSLTGGEGSDTAVFSGARAGYSFRSSGSTTTVTDIDLTNGDDGTDSVTGVEFLAFSDQTITTESVMNYKLQILHLSDGEAGTLAPDTAPFLAALVDRFEDQFANSITLAGGDTFLPGPFLAAGTDPSVVSILNQLTGSTIGAGGAAPGVVDTAIHNLIGVEASGIGNHEFDLGSNVYLSSLTGGGFSGAQYASISANLVLNPTPLVANSADPLNARFVNTVGVGNLADEEARDLRARIAPSAVINEGGETIGLVGATTQILEAISSPSVAEILGFPFGPGPNGETNNMVLLAAQLQPVIDDLRAQGVNKIVLLSHLQQIQFEQELATLLKGVDIILAAGSNTRLGDADDVAVAFPGHDANFAGTYPILTSDADGKPTLIVNTDNEYTYLGRLVVEFDEQGEIVVQSLADNVSINGAYASTAANVAAAYGVSEADLATTAFAAGTRGGNVQALTAAVENVIITQDANVFGFSNVYLEGERIQVRTQETNLGNLTADANADAAREALGLTGDHAVVSIKNGGGIRAQIGTIINNPDGTVTRVAPEVDGEVSQLDVANALRFDNRLMAFDTTPQGLLNILNSPNALAPNNGGFVQIGGVRFSYNPALPAGQRVQDIVLINEFDQITAVIADNGVVVPGAPSLITAVALNFTANGGDGYLIKPNAENFRFLLNDGTLSAPVDEALNFTSTSVVPANALGEQAALADYFRERYATRETAYDIADTVQALDTRIQNQAVRADTVQQGEYLILGTNAGETINGTSRGEVLKALAGNDIVNGGEGDDTINGGTGADRINGDGGIDTATYINAASGVSASLHLARGLFGEAIGDRFTSVENLTGSGFGDFLEGNSAANVINGGDGNDVIDGRGGEDTLLGGGGSDDFLIDAGLRFNTIDGGDGYDRILAASDSARIVWATVTGIEEVSSDGFADAQIVGGNGADTIDLSGITVLSGIVAINGGAGNDGITGSASSENLLGGTGNDTVNGSGGNDTITGGLGVDRLTGGMGNDSFVFSRGETSANVSLADVITDFAVGSDIIDLSRIDANTLNGAGDDAFTFATGAFEVGVAGQLRASVVGGETRISGDTNGDGRADFLIRLTGVLALTEADFVL